MIGPAMETRLPDLGPRYQPLRVVARGGSSAVFEAEDKTRGLGCAVKVLRVGEPTEALVERFRREVAMAERLQGHPGIVTAYDSGTTPEGDLYCVMDYVEGETLEDRIHDHDAPLAEKVQLLLDVARSVEFAHGREVIHRDLKPENVLVTTDGRARLTDFGISKALDTVGLTATGDRLGTPCYMAPEQIEDSKRVDERTDVYGLGAILYETLTAYRPFEGESSLAIMKKVVQEELLPPAQREPTVDPALAGLCERALAKDPDRRPQSARAFAEELAAWLESQSRPAGVDPQQGRRVAGRYELVERLGRGGYASVYRARQDQGEPVAVKLFDPRFGQTSSGRARFLREVEAMRAFQHPRAVHVQDFGEEPDGSLFLVMDLVPGETLAARLRRTPRLPKAFVLAMADPTRATR
jgi:serine/threonine protein kinase